MFDFLENEVTDVINAPMEKDPFTLYNDFYFSYEEEEGDGSLIWASLCIANQDESEIIFYTNRSSLIPEYEGTDFYYVRNLRTGEEIGLDKMLGAYKQDKMIQFFDNEIIFEHNGKLVALNIRNGQERTYIPEESNRDIKCTRNANITQSGYIFDIEDTGSWIKPDNDANIESRITYEDIKNIGKEKYYDIGHNSGQQEVKDNIQLKSNGWSTSLLNTWTMLHEYSQFTYTTPNGQQTIWYKETNKGIQIVDYVIQSEDMYYRLDSGNVDPILCYNPSDESIIHYPTVMKDEIKKKLDELAKCVLFVKPYCITIDEQNNLNVINFVEDKVKNLSFNALKPYNLEGDLYGEKVLFISQPNTKSFYRSLYILDLTNMNYKILTPALNILIENAFWTKDGKVYIEFRQIDWNTQIEIM